MGQVIEGQSTHVPTLELPNRIGYQPKRGPYPAKFTLGMDGGKQAAVILDETPDLTIEKIVTLAAGAWKALMGEDCAREMAERIAKAWLREYSEAQMPSRIYLPPHITPQ